MAKKNEKKVEPKKSKKEFAGKVTGLKQILKA
jgi:hypothetical protein